MELADSLGPATFSHRALLWAPLPSRLTLVAYSLWIKYSHTLVACIEPPGYIKYGYQSYPVKERGASKCWSTESNVSKVAPHLRSRRSFAKNT